MMGMVKASVAGTQTFLSLILPKAFHPLREGEGVEGETRDLPQLLGGRCGNYLREGIGEVNTGPVEIFILLNPGQQKRKRWGDICKLQKGSASGPVQFSRAPRRP